MKRGGSGCVILRRKERGIDIMLKLGNTDIQSIAHIINLSAGETILIRFQTFGKAAKTENSCRIIARAQKITGGGDGVQQGI